MVVGIPLPFCERLHCPWSASFGFWGLVWIIAGFRNKDDKTEDIEDDETEDT